MGSGDCWFPASDLADVGHRWDAQGEFGGVVTGTFPPLSTWEQYAQVLLLSNEFSFID